MRWSPRQLLGVQPVQGWGGHEERLRHALHATCCLLLLSSPPAGPRSRLPVALLGVGHGQHGCGLGPWQAGCAGRGLAGVCAHVRALLPQLLPSAPTACGGCHSGAERLGRVHGVPPELSGGLGSPRALAAGARLGWKEATTAKAGPPAARSSLEALASLSAHPPVAWKSARGSGWAGDLEDGPRAPGIAREVIKAGQRV